VQWGEEKCMPVFGGKPEGKWSHGKPRHRLEVNYNGSYITWQGILWITAA